MVIESFNLLEYYCNNHKLKVIHFYKVKINIKFMYTIKFYKQN